jgi:hypothetical protein
MMLYLVEYESAASTALLSAYTHVNSEMLASMRDNQ